MNLTGLSWINHHCPLCKLSLVALQQLVHMEVPLCVLTEACLCPLQLLKAQRAVMMSQAKALTQGAVMQIHK